MTKVLVKEKGKEIKNIFFAGNIVQLKTEPASVILVTCRQGDSFSGVVLNHHQTAAGHYSTAWTCERFEQFKGTVELTVD